MTYERTPPLSDGASQEAALPYIRKVKAALKDLLSTPTSFAFEI